MRSTSSRRSNYMAAAVLSLLAVVMWLTARGSGTACFGAAWLREAKNLRVPFPGSDLVQRSSAKDEHAEHGADGHTHGAAEATMSTTVSTARSLAAGQKTDVTLVLEKRDGSPVTLIPNRSASLTATIEGLTYAVTFDGPLKVGAATLGKLTVRDASGAVFPTLEPIMGAYAHLVGFSEDFKTIAHIHPMGEEPKSASDRGAGELEFHIQPEKAGLVRLFAQVQIGGQSKFVPFTLNIEP